jgi:hypothetical protein
MYDTRVRFFLYTVCIKLHPSLENAKLKRDLSYTLLRFALAQSELVYHERNTEVESNAVTSSLNEGLPPPCLININPPQPPPGCAGGRGGGGAPPRPFHSRLLLTFKDDVDGFSSAADIFFME